MGRGLNWTSLPKKYRKKSGTKKVYCPLEEEEQMKLAEYLDWNRYCWLHVPNEGMHEVQYRVKQKQLGLKKGTPDVFIFDIPDNLDCRGIVIELKREEDGRTSEEQEEWLNMLKARGWLTKVCKGADEAIDYLENLFEEDKDANY